MSISSETLQQEEHNESESLTTSNNSMPEIPSNQNVLPEIGAIENESISDGIQDSPYQSTDVKDNEIGMKNLCYQNLS